LEIEKGVNSKGPTPAQGFGLAAVAACNGQQAKRPHEAGHGGQSGYHTAQAGLVVRARREHVCRGHRVRCADRGMVTGGG
jgi:hypothetical protein